METPVTLKVKLLEVYNAKGLNGLWAYMRKNNIEYTKTIFEFGYASNYNAGLAKKKFVEEATPENVLQLHFAARGVTSRRNGFHTNIIQGVKITF